MLPLDTLYIRTLSATLSSSWMHFAMFPLEFTSILLFQHISLINVQIPDFSNKEDGPRFNCIKLLTLA